MGMEIDMKKIGSSRTEKENNIKLDIIALLDDIDNGKYSNIQINYYFNEKKYSYKEKMFITNIINITLKNLIYIDYMLSKVTQNIHKRKIRHLLRISAAQLFFTEADAAGILYEAGELSRKINSHQVSFVNAVLHSLIKNKKYIEDDIPSDKKSFARYASVQTSSSFCECTQNTGDRLSLQSPPRKVFRCQDHIEVPRASWGRRHRLHRRRSKYLRRLSLRPLSSE